MTGEIIGGQRTYLVSGLGFHYKMRCPGTSAEISDCRSGAVSISDPAPPHTMSFLLGLASFSPCFVSFCVNELIMFLQRSENDFPINNNHFSPEAVCVGFLHLSFPAISVMSIKGRGQQCIEMPV
jgi:hypothetical protein